MQQKRKHDRRSIRLRGYDYSRPGYYFITICTKNRECIFGEIRNGNLMLNAYGMLAQKEWRNTETIRDNVTIDRFVVMPNHIHGIIEIKYGSVAGAYRDTPLRENGKTAFRSPSGNVGAIIRGFKSTVTKQVNKMRDTPGVPLWQRNYYEHIIRDEISLNQIREYIRLNPFFWERDRLHP